MGSQEPTYSLFPPLFATPLADEAVALATVAGINLYPWEESLLRKSLGVRDDGLFAAGRVGLIVSRQNGKSLLIEARELAGLMLLGEKNIVHTAQLFTTCKDAFNCLAERIETVPALREYFQDPKSGNSEVVIRTKDGGKIRYMARSKDSIRGLRQVDLLIADEAYALSEDEMGAAMPAQASAKNAQMWLASSAGSHADTPLGVLRERGRSGLGQRLMYAEWSAADGADVSDERVWAAVNPSYGYHLTRDTVVGEFESLSYEQFGRERCGMWEFLSEDEAIPAAEWSETESELSRSEGDRAIAVDVTPDRRFACVYAASVNADGHTHVELVKATGVVTKPGSAPPEGIAWVAEYLQRLVESVKPTSFVLAPGGPAGGLIPELAALGVEFTALSVPQVAAGAAAFYDAVMQKRLKHPVDTLLDTAVVGAVRQPYGKDAFYWGRKDIDVNISPLVCASNALFALGTAEKVPEPIGEIWGFRR